MKFQAGFCPMEARALLSLCPEESPLFTSMKKPSDQAVIKNWDRISLTTSQQYAHRFEIGKTAYSAYYLIFRDEEYSQKNIQHDLEIDVIDAQGYAQDPKARLQKSFRRRFESIRIDLDHWLEILSSNVYLNLYIAGHGRGAAIATLCAAYLSNHPIYRELIQIKMYLFGSPKVGNSYFVKEFNQKFGSDSWCYNVRHSRDLVPFIPLAPLLNPRQPRSLFCFKDVGKLVLLKGTDGFHETTLTGTFSRHRAHWYAHYLKQLFKSKKGLGFLDSY